MNQPRPRMENYNKRTEKKEYGTKLLMICPKCGEPISGEPHKCGEWREMIAQWRTALGDQPPTAEYLQLERIYKEAIRKTGGGFQGRERKRQEERLTEKQEIEITAEEIEFLRKVFSEGFLRQMEKNEKESEKAAKDSDMSKEANGMGGFLEDYKKPRPYIDPEL